MRNRWIMMPLILLGFLAFIAVGGAAVQWLWNWLVPSITGWRALTFWEALGLLALCRILFGGFGRSGSSPGRFRGFRGRRFGGWQHMTPEEQERFRHRMRERFDFDPSAGEGKEM